MEEAEIPALQVIVPVALLIVQPVPPDPPARSISPDTSCITIDEVYASAPDL